MPPDPFREALHALLSADRKLQMTLNGTLGTLGSVGRNNAWDAMLAAFAEVERLYAARVGEEYEVAFIQPDCGDPTVPEYRAEWGMVLHGTMPVWLHPDQRVRVSRIPAGDITGEAP